VLKAARNWQNFANTKTSGEDKSASVLYIPEIPFGKCRNDKPNHKFAAIDNKTVITGSFNWPPAAAHTNDDPPSDPLTPTGSSLHP